MRSHYYVQRNTGVSLFVGFSVLHRVEGQVGASFISTCCTEEEATVMVEALNGHFYTEKAVIQETVERVYDLLNKDVVKSMEEWRIFRDCQVVLGHIDGVEEARQRILAYALKVSL